MINWTRNRVVNFTPRFAGAYVELLVGIDGQPYDQALFFKFLADAGIVNDVSQEGSEEEIAERRRKRWDSYLGKIREFGIGFAVDENRKGSRVKRSVWKASAVAKQFASARLDYRQFMALQMLRVQLPRPSLPLQPAARKEIQRNVRIRPLRLIMQALDELEVRGLRPYLSRDEVFGNLNRQWIGIDITHLAITLIKHRLHDAYGGPTRTMLACWTWSALTVGHRR